MVISYRHKRRRHRRRRDQSRPRRISQSHCRAVSSTCVSSDCISSPAAVGHPREWGRRGDSGRVYSVDPSASRRQSRGRSQADQTFLPQSSRSSLALGGAPMPNLNTSILQYNFILYVHFPQWKKTHSWLWFIMLVVVLSSPVCKPAYQRQRTAELRCAGKGVLLHLSQTLLVVLALCPPTVLSSPFPLYNEVVHKFEKVIDMSDLTQSTRGNLLIPYETV